MSHLIENLRWLIADALGGNPLSVGIVLAPVLIGTWAGWYYQRSRKPRPPVANRPPRDSY